MKIVTKARRALAIVLICSMAMAVVGCSSEKIPDVPEEPPVVETTPQATLEPTTVAPTPETTPTPTPTVEIKPVVVEEGKPLVTLEFFEDGTNALSDVGSIYSETLTIEVKAPEGARVYYTLDCTEPTEESVQYTEGIVFEPVEGKLPDAYVLSAKALLPSGAWSKKFVKTYFVAENINERYSTLVFSVVGEPADLTEKPKGIFYGKNYSKRGKESERPVHVEAFGPDGYPMMSQFAGVRIYGGYSRQYSIKSMKLFARKSYDEEHGSFKFGEFGTPRLDGSGKTVNKYDKLVLRDGGNDFQFCFLRDELNQALCKEAGFDIYEAVLPAVVYLNGEYYGLEWLHESYCDEYFKEKFGKDAPGEFVVLEGSDRNKKDSDDPLEQQCADEFNSNYDAFVAMDLTDDANYKKLGEFIDIENYIDYFAWNITLNNWDWPNNNYKCVKYVAAEGDTYKDGVFDGKWRFIPHDMDYCYGLYGQEATQPFYDTLRVVMNPRDNRYAPLFTKLMERDDCKEYFKNKTTEYLDTALSEETITTVYKLLDESRRTELEYFYERIDTLRKKGDFSLWCTPSSYFESETHLLQFAKNRRTYALKQIDRDLYGIS